MHTLRQNIEHYLLSCRELTVFLSQSGWIDKNSLRYEIIEQNDRHVIAFVQFEEILMEGSACVAGRIPRQGRLCLTLDHYGRVSHAQLL